MDERETVVGALRQAFESEPEVVFAYLFGSLAAGGFGPSSDIDVAVMISGVAPSMRKRLSLHHRLAKSFNREIDLVILNDARSFELRRVIATKGKILIDRDPAAREDFELYAIHDWIDFQGMKASIHG